MAVDMIEMGVRGTAEKARECDVRAHEGVARRRPTGGLDAWIQTAVVLAVGLLAGWLLAGWSPALRSSLSSSPGWSSGGTDTAGAVRAAPLHVDGAAGVTGAAGDALAERDATADRRDGAAHVRIRLQLEGRSDHATPFTLALVRAGEPVVPLIGRTDASGHSGSMRVAPGIDGPHDVILRVPGFLPARVLRVPVGGGVTEVDFSSGGLVPLRAGELTGDDAIGWADAWRWLRAWNDDHGPVGRDVDGDGALNLDDLIALWSNRGAPLER